MESLIIFEWDRLPSPSNTKTIAQIMEISKITTSSQKSLCSPYCNISAIIPKHCAGMIVPKFVTKISREPFTTTNRYI